MVLTLQLDMSEQDLKCCVEVCDKNLDLNYWDTQYKNQTTGWDLGAASPAFINWAAKQADKSKSILIPGCGNAYEAKMLWDMGFENITVIDIAPTIASKLRKQFADTKMNVITGDFFELEGEFDFILEQTFFCALPPQMRLQYVFKMHQLLAANGKLVGILFNREFEQGPPFGGNSAEYHSLFGAAFTVDTVKNNDLSIAARANSEVWVEFTKNNEISVQLITLNGITCSGCQKDATAALLAIDGCLQALINSNYAQLLVVSTNHISRNAIADALAYNPKISF